MDGWRYATTHTCGRSYPMQTLLCGAQKTTWVCAPRSFRVHTYACCYLLHSEDPALAWPLRTSFNMVRPFQNQEGWWKSRDNHMLERIALLNRKKNNSRLKAVAKNEWKRPGKKALGQFDVSNRDRKMEIRMTWGQNGRFLRTFIEKAFLRNWIESVFFIKGRRDENGRKTRKIGLWFHEAGIWGVRGFG